MSVVKTDSDVRKAEVSGAILIEMRTRAQPKSALLLATLASAALVSAVACGSSGGKAGDMVLDAGPDAGDVSPDQGVPATLCQVEGLFDVSSPTRVVGDGTAASCTAEALQAVATAGGTIVFDCGPDPVTIEVASTIIFTEETVLDGGDLVTLSGGGSARILYLDSNFDARTPTLVVQRLRFLDGQAPAVDEDTAQGGGAIYRDGGSLTVIDCSFDNNHAPSPGQDIAGGAIYGFGGGETRVVGSTFTNNAASNGGAIGGLNSDLLVLNSTLVGNTATGTDGNGGAGGAGGAVYVDGADIGVLLCGVTMANNRAVASGGGFFWVTDPPVGGLPSGGFAMDRSSVDGNRVTSIESGNAGGLYLKDLNVNIIDSTISRNQAFYNGGIWIDSGEVEMVNVTIAENTATSGGGGIGLGNSPRGRVAHCTIANNHLLTDGLVAGGIFGDGLILEGTIVADNSAPNCDVVQEDGTGNLQWPSGSQCTEAPLIADPLLSALADQGGATEVLLPLPASPAIGLGIFCPDWDQLGHTRPTPCTAGAVEPL